MAEAVVSTALATFRDLLVEEAKFLAGVGGEVRKLQTQLTEIKCLLRDADRKQHESESVRNWIQQIRDLTYRSEDAIASYVVQIPRGRGFLRRFSKGLSCFSLHQLGHEVSDIKSELARVTKDMRDYGIRSIIDGEGSSESLATANSSNYKWTVKTFPGSEIGECFVGKEAELSRLCSLVGDDENKHQVISVWGMGGIGKTTIAKKVYNQMQLTQKFESVAWVCITQQCQIRTVLESVLKQLNPEKGEGVSGLSDEQLIEQLCEVQRDKRCLIVFDDIWEISHWNGLKHAFVVEDLKSKILVTTRKQYVAEIGFSVELGLLSMDEALELLMKKSFSHCNNPDIALQEEILKIGKEIVCKCGYLLLAISLLGGVLSKKTSLREWELVNANIGSFIYRSEGHDRKDNQIEKVLQLSYEDLPYYLKPCFLYLSILIEDEEVYPMDIYRRWIAQGMISIENTQGNEETLSEIAELYLSEMVSRSLVQVELGIEHESIPTQKYRTCKLHDVVRELCVTIARKENFGAQILEYEGGKFSTLPGIKTRHLVIHFQRELQWEHDNPTIPSEEHTCKHLRSLEIRSHIHGKTIEFPPRHIVDLHKFKMLKSLVIERFKFVGRKLPGGITTLVHLKYLGLTECELDELPSSIRNLTYLDTLCLLGSWNIRVPNVLKKMFRLKHLLLPFYDKNTIGNYRMKLDLGNELETLWRFDSSVHELKSPAKMKNLRRFSATIRDNESLSIVIRAIATEWTKLQYCAVSLRQGCNFTSNEGMEEKLRQVFTCPNLYYLMIHVQLGKLLSQCNTHIINSKLVELTLEYCEIEDDPMLILGKLPTLKKLFYSSRSFVGEELTCPSLSFPRLTVLVLSGLPNWKEWRVEEAAMPLLSYMHIHYCPRFQKLPDGLSRVSTLQKLIISGMPELGRRVLESGEDFCKVCHVPSIIIN